MLFNRYKNAVYLLLFMFYHHVTGFSPGPALFFSMDQLPSCCQRFEKQVRRQLWSKHGPSLGAGWDWFSAKV
jgi:hypothetical protein